MLKDYGITNMTLAIVTALSIGVCAKEAFPNVAEPVKPEYYLEKVEVPGRKPNDAWKFKVSPPCSYKNEDDVMEYKGREYSIGKSWLWKSENTRLEGFEIQASDEKQELWLSIAGYGGTNKERPENATQHDTHIYGVLEKSILTANPNVENGEMLEFEARVGLGLGVYVVKKQEYKNINILEGLNVSIDLPAFYGGAEFVIQTSLLARLGPAELKYGAKWDFSRAEPLHSLTIGARF